MITRERLDRVMGNWNWRSSFPHAIASALPSISSDHSIIMLQCCPQASSGKPFRYEAFWEEEEECGQIIQASWAPAQGGEDPWTKLAQNFKSCSKNLQKWHKEKFKRADTEIFALKKRLNQIQLVDHSQIDWDEIKGIKARIAALWKQEEIFWGQRSRIKWLKWGDKNTHFFHASTLHRRVRNRIHRLKLDSGEWIEGERNLNK